MRVPDPLPAVAADDSAESTFIPSNLSRWREESIALDSLTASFCVAAVRTKLVARLSEIFEKEQADKKSASSALGVQVVPTGHPESACNTHVVPTVPNPSDEVTPSAPTPRATSAAVEQMQSSLQSSLRAVADALAQTVVRNLGSQGAGGGDAARTDSEAAEVTEISSRRTTVRTVGEIEEGSSNMEAIPEPPPLEMVPPPPPPSDRQESVAAAGVSVLSTFDGSQESARATLANTDPSDPLYTFLSAVAGAPAPPLPESSLETSARSPSHHQPSSLSPRLPIFTQLQSSPAVTLAASGGGALPLPVIQGPRTVGQTTQSTGSTVIVPQFAVAPPTSSSPSNSSQGSSQAEPVDLWQPCTVSATGATMHPESAQLSDPLVRAGSPQHGPGPADNATPYTISSVAASSAHMDVATESLPLPMPTSTTSTSSPSPSDTLAPLLLSSLQVAVSGRSSPPSTTSGGLPVIPHPDGSDTGGLRGQGNVPLPLGHEVDPNQTVTLLTTGQTVTQVSDSQDTAGQGAGSSSGQATSEQVSSQIADEVASRIASQVTSQATLEQAGGASSSATREEAEEIDPTFLAALPESIRQEVLLQHERERRLRQQPSTISPEFLAALPPEIQDEVRKLYSYVSAPCTNEYPIPPCTRSSWESWYLYVHCDCVCVFLHHRVCNIYYYQPSPSFYLSGHSA